jgi:hypothetical protein
MQRIAFRQLPPLQKSVLLAMANYAFEDGTSCYPSLATLAAWTGRSEARTKVAVRALRVAGLIRVTRPHAPYRPAEYRLVLRAIEALPSARDAQQLDLFSQESGADPRFPQTQAGIGVELGPFSTVSTGVHRSPAIRTGIAGDPRSVYVRSGYKAVITTRARDRKTGTR